MQTTQQLTSSDLDTTIDLYEYRFEPGPGNPRLTQISAGDGSTGVIGSGAKTLGLTRLSENGRRMYFVAEGKLTTSTDHRGNQPSSAAGARNLYLFERTEAHPDGRIRFVGGLSSSDGDLWSNNGSRQFHLADPSGRFAVFASVAQQTDDDLDTSADIFRYDAVTGEVVRISHGSDGYDGNTPGFNASLRGLSTNEEPIRLKIVDPSASRILFHTNEALQDGDVSGSPGTRDIYEWHDDRVAMITDGQDYDVVSNVYGMDADGSSVLFPSTRPLARPDVDGGTSVYVARVNGGYALESGDGSTPCAGDGCQGVSSPRPVPPVIGSVSFAGNGNLVPGAKPAPTSIRVNRLNAVTGSVATLKVRVPAAGRIIVSGSRLRVAKRPASKAGAYSVRLRLNPRARQLLRSKSRLRVTARVVFRAKQGPTVSRTIKVTFKQPKRRHAMAKGGGR